MTPYQTMPWDLKWLVTSMLGVIATAIVAIVAVLMGWEWFALGAIVFSVINFLLSLFVALVRTIFREQ